MTKLKFLPLVNTALILGGLLFFGMSTFNKTANPKMVYVDTVTLFQEFHMTKDLKKDQGLILKGASKVQDSLVAVYNALPDKSNAQANQLRTLLTVENQKLQELQQNLYQELNIQVWNRLNGYVKEFNNSENLDIIFGSNGTGNILQANDTLNKTEALLMYVNSRYEGGMQKAKKN